MRFKRNNTLSKILPRPVAFVFSGGTSLGAVQVGMLMGVFESNMAFLGKVLKKALLENF